MPPLQLTLSKPKVELPLGKKPYLLALAVAQNGKEPAIAVVARSISGKAKLFVGDPGDYLACAVAVVSSNEGVKKATARLKIHRHVFVGLPLARVYREQERPGSPSSACAMSREAIRTAVGVLPGDRIVAEAGVALDKRNNFGFDRKKAKLDFEEAERFALSFVVGKPEPKRTNAQKEADRAKKIAAKEAADAAAKALAEKEDAAAEKLDPPADLPVNPMPPGDPSAPSTDAPPTGDGS